ncbi:MAG: HAMP domain-containing sensor histidine kinase [Planctomycetota bacterium]
MSLLLRLTVPLALLFLAAFSFVGYASVRIAADTVERGLEERVAGTLATISANPEFFVIEAAVREESAGHLSQVADLSGFEIVVSAPDGLSVAASTVGRRAARELLTGPRVADRFAVVLDGVEYRAARGVVLGRPVFLLARAAPVEAAKSSARRRVLMIASIGLAVTVLLGLALAGTVMRPIRRLAGAVAGIREARVRPDLPSGGGREVEELRAAFLDMLSRLDRYREELVSREKMATLGQFSAAVAHELRNPLSSMRMTLDLLRDEVGEAGRRDVDVLRSEAARLDHSVEELLFYAGEPRYEMRAADLADVARAAARMVGPLAEHLDVALAGPSSTETAPLTADPNRLRQAAVNLLLNAVNASGPGDSVGIRVEQDTSAARILVTDEGPGVPADLAERIFLPFVTGRSDGTGLGLSVTRAIARAHGGTVAWAREGGATTFTLELPKAGR